MIHGGEGDVSTGEINRKAGCYRSECCQAQYEAAVGETMPPCSRCGEPADWTRTSPLDRPATS